MPIEAPTGLSHSEDIRACGHGEGGTAATVTAAALSVIAITLATFALMTGAAHLTDRPINPFASPPPTSPGPTALPEGSVIAVAGDTCPAPWREYRQAQGRFLLGAGPGANRDADGAWLTPHRAGEAGGRAGVALTLADLPPHLHRLSIGERRPDASDLPFALGGVAEADAEVGVTAPFAAHRYPQAWGRERSVEAMESVGGVVTSDGRQVARRHDNVPPFVALTFCILTNGVPDLVTARD